MPQIDVKDLDHSQEMRNYFHEVRRLLVEQHGRSVREADSLVGRFFAIDVDPLERALVMHDGADRVAADLARQPDGF